ncbi:MAG TPA: cupin domain-containing protein [Gemmatimonadaceae bacterium]|nr:cupin domain-containing protein [Gemmatimonadaceae bacterium]
MKRFASVIVVASLFLTATSVAMRADHAHAGQNLGDAKWSPAPPFLPKGAQIAVLEGDPTKPGLYAVRLKFPEHYAIPAHSHPTNEHVVVTSGALVFGMGDVLDKRSSANTKLTVGGFVDASANVNHFAFTRDEETTIVLYGEGPVEFNYVNPNDDPRNQPSTTRRQ